MSDMYVQTGDGATDGHPVVLVHGAGLDHTSWRFQTRWLAARGYRLLAPDLPGHGDSPGPNCRSIEEYAGRVAGLIESSVGSAVSMVGHSMGALIALAVAAVRPELASALILVGSSAHMKVHHDLMTAAHEDLGLAARLIAGWSFPASYGGGHPEPGTWEPGGVVRVIARSGEGVLAADLAACEAYDPGPAGRRLTLPTLIVTGSDDRMTSARGAQGLADLIPGSRLEVISGAGHQPMSQTPRRFNAVLGDFLTSSGKSSDR